MEQPTDGSAFIPAGAPLLNMVQQRAIKFPQAICLAAQHAERATGCWSSVALGQGALESGYFNPSEMPPDSFNCLGIKALAGQPSVTCVTKEWDGHQYITITSEFRKFNSFDDAFLVHGHLLTDPMGPYGSFIKYLSVPDVWLERFASTYATDPHYAAIVQDLIDVWQLADFNLPRQ